MDESRKVAIVTPIAPYPPDSGSKLRIYHLIRILNKEGFRVFLLVFDPNSSDRVPNSLKHWCEEIVFLKNKEFFRNDSFYRHIVNNLWRKPFIPRPKMTQELHKVLERWAPNFVQIEKTITANYLDIQYLKDSGMRIVLEEGGVHHLAYEREAGIKTSLFERWLFRRRACRLKQFETKLLDRIDTVIAVSEKEAKLLRRMNPRVNALEVPNGVDEKIVNEEVSPAGEREWAAFFCGNLSYRPNRDAVEICLRQVMPELKRKGIEMDFVIAGGGISKDLMAEVEKNSRFHLLGYVDDISSYFKKYAFFINPMRLGGGTRLKMLEAMAYGMACVSTSIGAEGIRIEPGIHALLADLPTDLAKCLAYLGHNPERVTKLGEAARNLVKEHYLWPNCTKALVSLYRK